MDRVGLEEIAISWLRNVKTKEDRLENVLVGLTECVNNLKDKRKK